MNIMELCLGPGLGGLELYVYRASKKLAENDHVHVVIRKDSRLAEIFAETNIAVTYLGKASKILPIYRALELAKLIDTKNIDVMHIHWGRDLSLAALAKKFSKRKPRLVYTRQMQITRKKDDFYHRFLYAQVDVFITITKLLAKLARSFLSNADKYKVTPLYYGVQEPEKHLSATEKLQLRRQIGFSESDFVVALFGRIEEAKGQHVLINALTELKNQNHDVKCLIVGHAMDDSYLASLRKSVSDNNISNNIYFMDFINNPQEWMQACDVIVLATREETFGLVLAEAMQAGVAVIGTDSGGVPEIIEHNNTGFLFDYGDVEGLSAFILKLKEDENKRHEFAKAGKIKAKKLFDIDDHYVKLRRILSDNN